MRVGLVFGGNTTEGEVSKSSAAGIRTALNKLGHEVVDIEFTENIAISIIDANVSVIFNAMHGQYGEDGCLQGLLDIMHIPYTHSGRLASAVAMNKELCKIIFDDLGIKTAKGFSIYKEQLYSGKWKEILKTSIIAKEKELFCKPVCDGSSKDAFIIHDPKTFNAQEIAFTTASEKFLIEERLHGREIQVAVLGKEPKAIGMIEVRPKGEFYDYHSKYDRNGAIHQDVNVDDDIKQEILQTAIKIHKAIGLKDISRSEFFLTDKNEIYALEVNSHPGFTPTSIVPEIALKAGIGYEDIVEMLLKNAKFG